MNQQPVNEATDGQSELTAGLGCTLCAHGNDLPEGEWCRACGLGLPVQQEAAVDELSPLAKAVKAARGGDAPIPKRGYA